MSTAIAIKHDTSIIEDVIAKGDLKALSPEQRAKYYSAVCESMGLNPLSQPFQYIVLNGKLQLYATKGATDQLNRIHGISVRVDRTEIVNDVYIVYATGQDQAGRQSSDIGAVNIKGAQGDNLANAMMKATTKAKRRVTMSMCGLGMLDETEVDTIPSAQRVPFEPQIVEVATSQAEKNTEKFFAEPEPQPPTFDERLFEATGATGKKQKDAFNALYQEAIREKDTDKLRLLVKAVPTYDMAEYVMHNAFDKHQLHTKEMKDALDSRTDAPGFVDVATGEISDE